MRRRTRDFIVVRKSSRADKLARKAMSIHQEIFSGRPGQDKARETDR